MATGLTKTALVRTLAEKLELTNKQSAAFLDLLDSQMTVVDVDLASIDALADFNMKMADLEMAVGAPLNAQEATK